MSEVREHLLFHKALRGLGSERLDEYLALAEKARSETAVASITDEFPRTVALLFHLVLNHRLDPGALDLELLLSEYQRHALRAADLDLALAGNLLGWAWEVLRLRAAEAVTATDPPPPDDDWEPFDFGWEPTYGERLDAGAMPLTETVRFQGERRVTLMELMGALEQAREGEALRQRRIARRRRLRERREAALADIADGLADRLHSDDPLRDQEVVWQRINRYNGGPIPLQRLMEVRERDEVVRTFRAALFLAHGGRIAFRQRSLRRPDLTVHNLEAS